MKKAMKKMMLISRNSLLNKPLLIFLISKIIRIIVIIIVKAREDRIFQAMLVKAQMKR